MMTRCILLALLLVSAKTARAYGQAADTPEPVPMCEDVNENGTCDTHEAKDVIPQADDELASSLPTPKAATPTFDEPLDDSGVFSVTWTGYLRATARWSQNDDDVGFIGRNDGFGVQAARLVAQGSFKDKARLVIGLDGATTSYDTTEDTVGRMTVTVRDALAGVFLSRDVELLVGRFKPMYDVEEFLSTRNRLWVDRTVSSDGVPRGRGWELEGLGIKRDLGLAVRRSALVPVDGINFGWDLAVMNGSEELDAANDNDIPAISGNAMIAYGNSTKKQPLFYAWVSARYSKRTEGEFPNLKDSTDVGVVAGARFQSDRVIATAQGLLRRRTFQTVTSSPEMSYGGMASVLVRVPMAEHLWAGYRYSILDMSDLLAADRVQEHGAGVVYELPEWHVRFILNYTMPFEQSGRHLQNQRVDSIIQVGF